MSVSPSSTRKKHSYVDPAAFTPHFAWKHAGAGADFTAQVYCEGVALAEAAQQYGTPAYLYSRAALTEAFQNLHRHISGVAHTICFAVKSNGNLSILRHLARQGSGFDVVSGGELAQLRHIGVPGNRIVFSGVGKTREEIRSALQYRSARSARQGILLFNIESEAELAILLAESRRHVARGGAPPSVSIRINPDVQAGGHPHISTGHHQHKFGLNWDEARRLYLAHQDSRYISWRGISAHIGSQIVSLDPFRRALRRMAACVRELRREGIALKYLDFGGGLGVRYATERPASTKAYAEMVTSIVSPLGVHLLLEPGRSLIAASGVLLTRVIHIKENRGKTFVVVDAGMNDLMRPALYGAVHPITGVTRDAAAASAMKPKQRVDIVGPVCESGDCFLSDWPMHPVQPGDVLAIWTAGAYGMSLASNYNARCRPVEILVEGRRARIIRRRETFPDLIRGDILA
ncbi:MAG: diaminopimelate decarboxylase [Candidatus Acidiferrum sp.]